jgi:hypothetical protein
MMKLRMIGAVAAISTVLAGPALAQTYGYVGGSQSGQPASEYGGQQDSRQYSPRNYVDGYAYNTVEPGYAYREREGFWPGDVASNVVSGAIGTADAAIGTAGAIATAPFRSANASMDMDETTVVPNSGVNNSMSCSQRYRSFDPASGTYLGYDGQRHPCT